MKFFFLIYVKEFKCIRNKQSIIDKVLDKKQIKIDYSYGSLETKKIKSDEKFF